MSSRDTGVELRAMSTKNLKRLRIAGQAVNLYPVNPDLSDPCIDNEPGPGRRYE